MSEPRDREPRGERTWGATWKDAARHRLASTLSATPAQRLDWLEEMLELAWSTGALPGGTPSGPGE